MNLKFQFLFMIINIMEIYTTMQLAELMTYGKSCQKVSIVIILMMYKYLSKII